MTEIFNMEYFSAGSETEFYIVCQLVHFTSCQVNIITVAS